MEHNKPVFRSGKRVFLGPVLKEDLPQITLWINDPEVTQYLAVTLPMTVHDEEKWFAGLSERKPTDIVFAVRLVRTGEIIGITGLHRVDFKDGIATTGSFIGRKDLWSKGYGTEAKMVLLEYAFNTLNLHKVSCEVYDFNPRSKRCQEKCGYVVEGVQKEHRFRNGRRADCYMMAVFKRDFLPLWEKYRKDFLAGKASRSTKHRHTPKNHRKKRK